MPLRINGSEPERKGARLRLAGDRIPRRLPLRVSPANRLLALRDIDRFPERFLNVGPVFVHTRQTQAPESVKFGQPPSLLSPLGDCHCFAYRPKRVATPPWLRGHLPQKGVSPLNSRNVNVMECFAKLTGIAITARKSGCISPIYPATGEPVPDNSGR